MDRFGKADPVARQRHAVFAIESLRIEILRHLLGDISYRNLAKTLCMSDLLAQFCGLHRMDGIRCASKSTLERRSKLFTEEDLRALLGTLSEICGNADLCAMIDLEEAVDMSVCLVDSTCLETNIHFPVDWVLLRDVSRTLLKALKLIRAEGIVCRMPWEPERFAREMNRLCVEMTHSRRRPQSKKARKGILRKMKKLLRTIGRHADRHADKLREEFERTRFSETETGRIVARIEGMSAKIGEVIQQAHERIIGGRQVPNREKILSVYQEDTHVIVRGKAGKNVEFGNTLMISENLDGYILDWKLYKENAPSEWRQLEESMERLNELDLEQEIAAVCTDRGFANKSSSARLVAQGIYDATCPRDPSILRERMREEQFQQLQRRRGGTEGRISTLKNRWLAPRVMGKSFTARNLAVGWAVLSHNLWFMARKLAQQREKERKAA